MGTPQDDVDVFAEPPPPSEYRLVVIGKTGNGKSTVGNIILSSSHFRVGYSMTSTTLVAATGQRDSGDLQIKVVDTPDVTNSGLDDDAAQREVGKWKALTSPEAHAILLAVRCDVRYTREEYDIFLRLQRLWGGDTLSRRLVVVFTFGDRQDADIDEELKRVCPELKSVLKAASHRYVVFNDRDSEERKARVVADLMKLVEKLDEEVTLSDEERMMNMVQVCPPCTGGGSLCAPQKRGSSSCPDVDSIRLLLVGRLITEKSSTGNTIIGRAAFPGKPDGQQSSKQSTDINGKRVQVVDTPALRPAEQDQGSAYKEEMTRAWDQLVSPGPHALLYVVRHADVTKQDVDGFLAIKKELGEDIGHHTILVLVGEKASGEERPHLSTLLKETEQRAWMLQNTADADTKRNQVEALLALVDNMTTGCRARQACTYSDGIAKKVARRSSSTSSGNGQESCRPNKSYCLIL